MAGRLPSALKLALFMAVFSITFSQALATHPWYQTTGWNYAKEIMVSQSSGIALKNYQVKVTDINTTALYREGKLNDTCKDVRFADTNGNAIDFYIENCVTNGGNSTFWIEVPNLASGTTTIVFYYGNPTAATASNYGNTFYFFDDFSGAVTDKWAGDTGAWTITSGKLTPPVRTSNDSYIYVKDVTLNWTYGAVDLYITDTDVSAGGYHLLLHGGQNQTNDQLAAIRLTMEPPNNVSHVETPANAWNEITVWNSGVYKNYTFGTFVNSTDDYYIGFVNGVFQNLTTISATYSVSQWLKLSGQSTEKTWYIDDIRIRNYTYPEPTYIISGEANSTQRMITNCSDAANDKKALQFDFYDEGASTSKVNATIDNIQFDFNLTNGTEQSVTVPYGYGTTLYACIYPGWDNFTVNMQAQYSATDYNSNNWYLDNALLNNVTQVINLYLINSTDGTQIAIHVRDEGLNNKEGAEVRVMRWMAPNYITTSILHTDNSGMANVYIQKGEWYKFQILYNGVVYATTTQQQLDQYSLTNPKVIDVSFATAIPYLEYLKQISYIAYYNSTNKVAYFQATDSSGLSSSGNLKVTQITITGTATICNNVTVSASFIMTCDLSAQPNGTYAMVAYMVMKDGAQYVVYTLPITIGAGSSGIKVTDGLIMAIIFIGTISFAGLVQPTLAILLTVIGLFAMALTGFIMVNTTTIIGILCVGLILIFLMKKGGGG